jgi:hypothetical protein
MLGRLSTRDRLRLVVALLAAGTTVLALTPLGGCSHRSPRPGGRGPAAPSWREHVIWPRLASLPSGQHALRMTQQFLLARRFVAPVEGHAVDGAFYVAGSDRWPTDVVVSIWSSDADGSLGHPERSRVCSVRVSITGPARDADPQRVIRVPFSMQGQLHAGTRYWLVLQPGWEETTPESKPYQRYVRVVSTGSDEQPACDETTLRQLGRDPPYPGFSEGPGKGDWNAGAGLVAELRVLQGPSAAVNRP